MCHPTSLKNGNMYKIIIYFFIIIFRYIGDVIIDVLFNFIALVSMSYFGPIYSMTWIPCIMR